MTVHKIIIINPTTTYHFVEAVNQSNLCGYSDWRLPTRYELFSILDHTKNGPAIDTEYFPNTLNDVDYFIPYWSGTPSAQHGSSSSSEGHAWMVNFRSGVVSRLRKNTAANVRLVRSL